MPQATILFDEEEDKVIKHFQLLWGLSKVETVKKIVKDFGVNHATNN